MNHPHSPSSEVVPFSGKRRVDKRCDRFEAAWIGGERPRIEDYLADVPEPERSLLFRELLGFELAYRRLQGDTPLLEEYRQRFSDHAELVQTAFREQAPEPKGEAESPHESVSTGLEVAGAGEPEAPTRLGRYRIRAVLGTGGFGVVYQGYDEALQRLVALKVPHRHRIDRPADVEAYLAEARILAGLDHPHIVPVHDVGRTDDGLCYVVSKFIEGRDLKATMKEDRPAFGDSAALVARIAEALHYAHCQGLVHRDIKPGNILLDRTGRPYVADFGLALKKEEFGKGANFAGTPAYMSPEQARGEGHRVDGRSDIFSLGVVFYELLTERRPFRAEGQDELLAQIITVEARPPRQVDDTVPKELERICLKALAKRASERYTTAKDMADDLQHFLEHSTEQEKSATRAGDADAAPPTPTPPPSVKIVPKGLRSFDAQDADFFMELLPGPRDRDGLPESIRFWKTRIEQTDPDQTFSVGLIYGPSGCGKSSLVKAGLLPRLAKVVTAVYVEATAQDTETRLRKGLRKHCPDLPADLGLADTLAALRRGQGLPLGQKVLLVLDQFEQWLHAKRSEENTELVQALRQCDGGRLQGLVLVRDDFGMASTRFMAALDLPIIQGQNFAAVDLFGLLHARKVLAEFGRAYGRLPDNLGDCTQDQHTFLDEAVAGLAEDGKIISVRQALFAEMIKEKPWTPTTLKEIGGTAGVGVTFLEETFTASTAPPQHRLHQKAAQAVLKTLLPESGTDIKGHMRSQQELLEASGYAGRPKDFDELLRILDGELRLITPTDPEGVEGESSPPRPAGGRYYQLTHDYLVPSLRDWLTRKQKETRRGRAELLLADRAAVWNARPENRQLPSRWQWLQIRWLTAKKKWTPPQRKMMAQARQYHAVRGMALGLLLALATATGLAIWEHVNEKQKATHAAGLVQAVLNADTAQVPDIISKMAAYRQWTDPLLRGAYDQATAKSAQQLHASLALLPVDLAQVDYLYERLLDAEPSAVPVIRDALAPYKDGLLDKLWVVAEASGKGNQKQRLRAAAALAKYDPDSAKWAKVQDAVGNDLVHEPSVYVPVWMAALHPVRVRLLPSLSVAFGDTNHPVERSLATDVLADYAVDQGTVLANLVMDADAKQFAIFFPKLKDRAEQGLPVLVREIQKKLPPDTTNVAQEKLAQRQANAALALLKLDRPEKARTVLKHSPNPRARSYLIHRLYPFGVARVALIKRLDEEPDVTIRRALLLSLGEYGEKELALADRQGLLPKVQDIYRTATDPGLHASAEWLLRTWKQEAWLNWVNDAWAKDKEQRAKRLEGIGKALAKDKEQTPPQWYVNGQGQTMVVIPGPVAFVMGSPLTEVGRRAPEVQHQQRIDRTFALAAKSVTVEQYRKFNARYGRGEIEPYARTGDSPVLGTSWYQAVAYCNWLSEEEGLPQSEWCYEPVRDPRAMPALAGSSVGLVGGSWGTLAATCGLFPGRTDPQYKEGMKLAKDYLQRHGYRLPTEAEMEYATRAGAQTARYYGETEALLEQYAWYDKNGQGRSWPVGSKKPNDLGLFDVQGNVYTWCQERYRSYAQLKSGEVSDDKEDALVVRSTDNRVLRGGAFFDPASDVRSAYRLSYGPANRFTINGCRPARTLPLGFFTALPPTAEGVRK